MKFDKPYLYVKPHLLQTGQSLLSTSQKGFVCFVRVCAWHEPLPSPSIVAPVSNQKAHSTFNDLRKPNKTSKASSTNTRQQRERFLILLKRESINKAGGFFYNAYTFDGDNHAY